MQVEHFCPITLLKAIMKLLAKMLLKMLVHIYAPSVTIPFMMTFTSCATTGEGVVMKPGMGFKLHLRPFVGKAISI